MKSPTPTYALISSFHVYEQAGQAIVSWQTSGEVGTVGFYLERFEAASGDYLRLNDHLLPGLLTSPEGGVYQYVDGSATPGETYRYRLIEVVAKGQENVYGPYTVSVVPEAPSPAARGLSKQARAELDNETLASGYSRKPYSMTAARKARLEAMKAEQAAANHQGALAQELRAKSQELTPTGPGVGRRQRDRVLGRCPEGQGQDYRAGERALLSG